MITAEEAFNNTPNTIGYYLNNILSPAITNLSSQGYRELILSDVPSQKDLTFISDHPHLYLPEEYRNYHLLFVLQQHGYWVKQDEQHLPRAISW